MDRLYSLSKLLLILPFIILPFSLIADVTLKDQLVSKADSLIEAGNYDAAVVQWKELLDFTFISEKERNLFQSKLHFTTGLRESGKSRYAEAVESFQKAESFGLEIKANESFEYLKDLYTSYYHALAYSGDWKAALAVSLKGFNHIEPYLKGKDKADYLYDLGYLNDKLGNFPEAIQLYEASIQELKTLDEQNYFDLGLAYHNLSTNYRLMAFFSARLNSLLKAREYWEADPDNVEYHYFITLYGNLLKVYLEYGDITLAEEMLHKADSVLHANNGKSAGQIINQHRLHIILLNAKNEIDKSEQRLNDFYAFYNSLNEADRKQYQSHLLASIQSLVSIQAFHNQIESSAHYLDIGLEIARKYDNLYFQMSLNSEYSKISDQRGEPIPVRIDYLNTALSVNEKTNIGQENLMTLNLRKAQYYDLNAQPDSAKQTIQIALTYLKDFEGDSPMDLDISHFEKQNSIYIIKALLNAADLYLSFYSLKSDEDEVKTGLHLYELAARVFESYYQKGSYNASLNKINREIKEGIFTSLQLLGEPLTDSLLELIEQNNSHTLRKEFEAKQQEYTLLPPELLNERNLLSAQMSSLNESIESYPDSLELLTGREKIQSEIKELSRLIEAIDPQFDRMYSASLTIAGIQEKLSPKELIIQYIQGSNKSFAVLVSKENIELFSLGSRNEIDSLVTDYHQKIKTLDGNFTELSESCYEALISPFREMLPAYDKLIIIPEGKLSYLAFESLTFSESENYLIETHNISYSPSLSLWNLTQSPGKSSASDKKLLAAFAPVYTDGYYSTRRIKIGENRLENLKGATHEARLIAENFGGDFFTDKEASKWHFIEQTNNYQVYHLAMHTIYDDEKSNNSELVFQNAEKLTFNELYSLHFPAAMVVLSACNTGIGQLQDGEGMQSLSQALSYSGVQSSVYSLWPVPDKETAEIMLVFYEKLKLGFTKSEALAEAKRVFIAENPLQTHPYFWAGFVLQGNQDPIVSNPISWLFWMAIGVGLVIFIALILRKRKISQPRVL